MASYITDIFGSFNVDDDTPFIMIKSNNISKLLVPLESGIYNYNKQLINKILLDANLTPNNFKFIYQIYSQDNSGVPAKNFILLANRNITKDPVDFVKIQDYKAGTFYLPIADKNYGSIGVLFSKTGKPVLFNSDIATIRSEYLSKRSSIEQYSNKINGILNIDQIITPGILQNTEFGSLSHLLLGNLTILRSKILNSNQSFKLLDVDGNYITHPIDGTNKLLLKNVGYDRFQYLNYNTDGELTINNQCLTPDDNTENGVYLDRCDKTIRQKWYPSQNTFVSEYDSKCLSSDGQNISMDNCANTQSQNWTLQQSKVADPNEYAWKTHKGRTVVLTESDNPWYVNKDITAQLKIIKAEPELNQVAYRDHADFKSQLKIKPYRGDISRGDSYINRLGDQCMLSKNGDILNANNNVPPVGYPSVKKVLPTDYFSVKKETDNILTTDACGNTIDKSLKQHQVAFVRRDDTQDVPMMDVMVQQGKIQQLNTPHASGQNTMGTLQQKTAKNSKNLDLLIICVLLVVIVFLLLLLKRS